MHLSMCLMMMNYVSINSMFVHQARAADSRIYPEHQDIAQEGPCRSDVQAQHCTQDMTSANEARGATHKMLKEQVTLA